MGDWKTHLSCNYTSAYHAYAYGLLYPHGFDQNHGGDAAGATHARGNLAGPTPAYQAAGAGKSQEGDSTPDSPEEHAGNGQYHYPSFEFGYLGESAAEGMIFSERRQASVDERPLAAMQAGSDTASDSETYISPGSWSSASSREGSQPQADCIAWAKADQDETSSRSPDTDSCGSPTEELRSYAILGNEPNRHDDAPTITHMEANAVKTPITNTPKSKARATFTDSQMNILSERFSMQRYLSPSEMRGLAEVTGLTYKQVKTWFQNRRMKLRREQKSTGTVWGPERYAANKDRQAGGAPFNHSPHGPPAVSHDYYRGDARPQLNTQHVMEAALKNPASQNLAFYLAAMAPNSGSAGYPSWSSIPSMPQGTGVWSMPPGICHYDYSPGAFSVAGGAPAEIARQDGKSESKHVDHRCPPNTALVNVSQ